MQPNETLILYPHQIHGGRMNYENNELMNKILETINNHTTENDVALMSMSNKEYWQGRLFESIDLQRDIRKIFDEYKN